MIYSTAFVMVLYVLLNFIFLYSTPIESMVGQIDIGYLAGVQIFGDLGGKSWDWDLSATSFYRK